MTESDAIRGDALSHSQKKIFPVQRAATLYNLERYKTQTSLIIVLSLPYAVDTIKAILLKKYTVC